MFNPCPDYGVEPMMDTITMADLDAALEVVGMPTHMHLDPCARCGLWSCPGCHRAEVERLLRAAVMEVIR